MPTKPAVPPIHITPPIFGVAYNVGWIGFTRCSGLVSDAISYGERRERGEFPEVTHVLIAIGDSQCIEAHAGSGVSYAKLSKYLDDPATHVYFRQPIGWTPEIGDVIARAAETKLGCSYDDLLIVEQALSLTLFGYLLNKLLREWPHRLLCALLLTDHSFICSMLGAYCLNAAPQYAGTDILAHPIDSINPQDLFECGLFEPFINDCSRAGSPLSNPHY